MIEKSFECDWKPYVHVIGRPNGVLKNFVSPLQPLGIAKSAEAAKTASTAPLAIACHNGMMTIIDCKIHNMKRKDVCGS
jgi:hypothetical protein